MSAPPNPHAATLSDELVDVPILGPGPDLRPQLLRAALDAADHGFRVFPLSPRTKAPTGKGWQRHATTDRDIIIARWRALPYNIGIACGNGLYVIDLDPSRGATAPAEWRGAQHGREVLADLAGTVGQAYPGDYTYRVATPSGGEHLYFATPRNPQFRNTAGRLGWRIDTRGTGGYVVGAGSVVPTGTYRLIDDRMPAPLPEWLITRTGTPLIAPHAFPVPDDSSARAGISTAALVDQQCQRVRQACSGRRHATLVSAAATLGRLVGARRLTRADARHALHAAAARHIGVDNFTLHEAERTIDDGLTFGIARTTPNR